MACSAVPRPVVCLVVFSGFPSARWRRKEVSSCFIIPSNEHLRNNTLGRLSCVHRWLDTGKDQTAIDSLLKDRFVVHFSVVDFENCLLIVCRRRNESICIVVYDASVSGEFLFSSSSPRVSRRSCNDLLLLRVTTERHDVAPFHDLSHVCNFFRIIPNYENYIELV